MARQSWAKANAKGKAKSKAGAKAKAASRIGDAFYDHLVTRGLANATVIEEDEEDDEPLAEAALKVRGKATYGCRGGDGERRGASSRGGCQSQGQSQG